MPGLTVCSHSYNDRGAPHGIPDFILGAGGHLAGGGNAPWLMFAAHAVATLVTALFLVRGEDALRLVATWLEPLVRLPDLIALPPTVRTRWRTDVVTSPASTAMRVPTRRGPPPFVPAALTSPFSSAKGILP